MKWKWRRLFFALHRDVGFVCLGLTVVYAVSGIAVNHRQHWDYNYAVGEETLAVGSPSALLGLVTTAPPDEGRVVRDAQDQVVERLTAVLGRQAPPRKAFWRGPDRLSLFFGEADEDVVDYLPSRGVVEHTVRRERFLVRAFNFLHLNESRRVWTWVADGYAAMLLFLAFSGVLLVRGRRGLAGRGGLLVALGVLVPVVAVLLLR